MRVDSRRQPLDVPPLALRATGAFVGGWWNYAGILREVYLRRVDSFDLADVLVRPQPALPHLRRDGRRRSRRVATSTRRRAARQVTGSFGGRGARFRAHRVPRARRERRFRARVRIGNPRLWSPARPEPLHGPPAAALDRAARWSSATRVHTGIRSLEVSRLGRMLLNGRHVNLRGASMHEDSLEPRGGADARRRCAQNIDHLRDLGATMTRAHYPLHPLTLELADRYGILVWSEIPVYQMRARSSTISRGAPQGAAHAAREITRDRNHPVGDGVEHRQREHLAAGHGPAHTSARPSARSQDLDPTRLVGLASSGFPTVGKQPLYIELDALGVNDYFGWYHGPARLDRRSRAAERLPRPPALGLSRTRRS